MALTSTITYCTNAEVFDVFPDINKYHNKSRVIGWKLGRSNFASDSSDAAQDTFDIYYADSTGIIQDLYWDGSEISEIEYALVSAAQTNGVNAPDTAQLGVNSISNIAAGDILKIQNEYMLAKGTTAIGPAVTYDAEDRGLFGTTRISIPTSTKVHKLIDATDDLSSDTSADGGKLFLYDSDADKCLLITNNLNPADYLIESGADFGTYLTRMIKKASRMVESQLDSRMSREVMKDREGNYPIFIVQATALLTVVLILKANDPSNEYLREFEADYREIIKGFQDGSIVLPNAITKDSSKGVLREVSKNTGSDLIPVELRGHYGGSDYELLKVKIEDGEEGLMGTSKYTVYGSDGDNLKVDVIVDSETINGRYQTLGVGNLQIRWGGDNVATATTNANDEYEIELHGYGIDTTSPTKFGSIRMTRTGHR